MGDGGVDGKGETLADPPHRHDHENGAGTQHGPNKLSFMFL